MGDLQTFSTSFNWKIVFAIALSISVNIAIHRFDSRIFRLLYRWRQRFPKGDDISFFRGNSFKYTSPIIQRWIAALRTFLPFAKVVRHSVALVEAVQA